MDKKDEEMLKALLKLCRDVNEKKWDQNNDYTALGAMCAYSSILDYLENMTQKAK